MIIKLYYKTIKSRQNLLYKGKKNLDAISSYQISRKKYRWIIIFNLNLKNVNYKRN
jgi:hypothetical protein